MTTRRQYKKRRLQSIRRSKSSRSPSVTDTKKWRKHGVKNIKNKTKIESLKHGYNNRKFITTRKKNGGGVFGLVDRFRNWRANNQGSHGALKPLSAPPPPEQPETQKTWKRFFTFGKSKIHNASDTDMPLNSMISTTPVLPAPLPSPPSPPPHLPPSPPPHLPSSPPPPPPPPPPPSSSHFEKIKTDFKLPPPPPLPLPSPYESNSYQYVKPTGNEKYDPHTFITGSIQDIDGKQKYTVLPVKEELIQTLNSVRHNNGVVTYDNNVITFVGDQPYSYGGHFSYGGTANIWVQQNLLSGDVQYIVKVIPDGHFTADIESTNWPIRHVPLALSLIKSKLLVDAMERIDVIKNEDKLRSDQEEEEVKRAKSMLENAKSMLENAKSVFDKAIEQRNRVNSDILKDVKLWTFTLPQS